MCTCVFVLTSTANSSLFTKLSEIITNWTDFSTYLTVANSICSGPHNKDQFRIEFTLVKYQLKDQISLFKYQDIKQ